MIFELNIHLLHNLIKLYVHQCGFEHFEQFKIKSNRVFGNEYYFGACFLVQKLHFQVGIGSQFGIKQGSLEDFELTCLPPNSLYIASSALNDAI